MIITRRWAMPNKSTFEIQPVAKLIGKHIQHPSVDPFAGWSDICTYNNDLDPDRCGKPMDAIDFLRQFPDSSIKTVLLDPPYSPRQVAEYYKSLDKTVTTTATQTSFWTDACNEIGRILQPGGKAISFGWNSRGIGKKNNMDIIEILLVSHGGAHNDTICTVDIKLPTPFDIK